MNGELRGQRALVTAGTRGIGAAVVQRLREDGATVLATARSNPRSDELFVAADIATADGCAIVADAVRVAAGLKLTTTRQLDCEERMRGGVKRQGS